MNTDWVNALPGNDEENDLLCTLLSMLPDDEEEAKAMEKYPLECVVMVQKMVAAARTSLATIDPKFWPSMWMAR